MLENNQSQKAGDGSSQIQANTINVYQQGIDEKRAREIVNEQIPEILNAYSQEARAIAEQRVSQFATDFVPKLVKENLLVSLSDPSVQILIKEAQKSAASTERPEDYSLLSELLIHRIKNDKDRNIRAGVTQAIKIVDEVSDEALLGLTVAHSVGNIFPVTHIISKGLTVLNDLFSKLLYDELPKGDKWIDQLDILNAVRMDFFGSLQSIEEIYSSLLSGYIDVGFKKGSAEHNRAIEMIKEAELPLEFLCNHELREGYIRLSLVSINWLDKISYNKQQSIDVQGQQKTIIYPSLLNEKQKETIKAIYALYETDNVKKQENIKAFMNMWNSYDNLRVLQEWWNSLPRAFELTCVGSVLAHANAQRGDPTIPNLDK